MDNKTGRSLPAKKINYGIDAPGVIRNIFIGSLVSFFLAGVIAYINMPALGLKPLTFISIGISAAMSGGLMLFYSLNGKLRYREHILNQVTWTGKEMVLDIGTGKGLLMVGAAKRLTSGKAFGIDIWNSDDLSGNNATNAFNNAVLEGVSGKVSIENQNVMAMSFPDQTFDIALSNLCLHNIYVIGGRKVACQEIYRVLKPGGVALISDFRHLSEYKNAFKALGMKIEKTETAYFNTFPPLTIIKAVKLI